MSYGVSNNNQSNLVHDNFSIYVLFGGILIMVGMIVAGSIMFVELATTFLFGLLLLIAGLVVILQSFVSGKWTTYIVHVFGGILLMGSGFLITVNPLISLAAFTLLLFLVFLAIGISKMVTSTLERDSGWEWDFIGGLAVFVLGLLIWRWPTSTNIGFLGLFLGFGIIATGISEIISEIKIHNDSGKNNFVV